MYITHLVAYQCMPECRNVIQLPQSQPGKWIPITNKTIYAIVRLGRWTRCLTQLTLSIISRLKKISTKRLEWCLTLQVNRKWGVYINWCIIHRSDPRLLAVHLYDLVSRKNRLLHRWDDYMGNRASVYSIPCSKLGKLEVSIEMPFPCPIMIVMATELPPPQVHFVPAAQVHKYKVLQ